MMALCAMGRYNRLFFSLEFKFMALSQDDVRKVAFLARLRIEDTDVTRYAAELTNAMELISNMEQADTDAVQPMAHPLHCTQRLRADDVTAKDERAKFQALAPKVEAGLYLVPQVIEWT